MSHKTNDEYLENMYQLFLEGEANERAKILETLTVEGFIDEAIKLDEMDKENSLNYIEDDYTAIKDDNLDRGVPSLNDSLGGY